MIDLSERARRRGGFLLAFTSFLMLGTAAAHAQSTGTQQVEEEVVVTGQKMAASATGLISAEQVSKSRSTITQEYIRTQPAGESIIQQLNLQPGVNFTNSDPYGSSGGNIRMRSFDGSRISLTVDGIPLNDTGNYAIYPNQMLDPEVIDRTAVNLGTTDVDSPTASATGGTINIVERKPADEADIGGMVSVGSFNYRRGSLLFDTGTFGPWDTKAFFQASYQRYDKFKGPGDLDKKQGNARLYQDLGDRGFISLSLHYNQNRNAFYRNLTLAQVDYYGWKFDNLGKCTRDAPTPGVADNDGAVISPANQLYPALPPGAIPPTTFQADGRYLSTNDNPLNPSSCTNYYNLRINPSNTGNARMQFSYALTDSLRFTFDPSFQYVLANGGGTTVQSENSTLVKGHATSFPTCPAGQSGVDLNGDGDCLDSVRFYTPNNTNTRRWEFTSSLIWDIDENNLLRAAYTWDYGRHRQTGEWTTLGPAGNPDSVWGGKDGYDGMRVYNADGYFLRQRDRFSIAQLSQFAIDYNGHFWDDTVRVSAGVRAPNFTRKLNQYCYTQSNSFAYCSSQIVTSTDANGFVTLAGQGATKYVPPFKATKKYDKVLPNVGISILPWGPEHTFYASYAEGFSAPRTDDLYAYGIPNVDHGIPEVQPETTRSYDLGYRYQSSDVIAALALWKTDYQNRIVSSYDQDSGVYVDRNVGKVDIWGFDAQAGFQATDQLTLYATTSYNHSEVQDNLRVGTATAGNPVYAVGSQIFLPTKGKRLVETPDWTVGGRAEYTVSGLTLGVQGKFVGKRFSTDVNDEWAPSYTTFDADATYDLSEIGADGFELQFNVINIFDKNYLGSISSTNAVHPIAGVVGGNAATGAGVGGAISQSAPTYAIGAPRTFQMSLRYGL